MLAIVGTTFAVVGVIINKELLKSMKRIFCLFILTLNLSISLSQIQNNREIKICDSKTKLPVPYTTVRSIDFKYGTYADSKGFFILNNNFTDSLHISSIGYIKRKISQKEIVGNIIYLEPYVIELKPIIVKSRKFIGEETLGIPDGNKSTVWGSGGYGDEFAQKISFPDTNKVYKIELVAIGAERFDETIPILLHVYSMGLDGFPNENILTNKILLTKDNFSKAKKKIIIDIRSENIFLKEASCFVGVEWLPVPSQGHKLPTTVLILTDMIPEALTYTRAFFYNKDK